MVLNFHGVLVKGKTQAAFSQFNEVADSAGFIVCYPNGILNSWNVGFGGYQDDVGFVSLLIDSLHAQYNIDLKRVYATGMSNGAFLCYRLACELSSKIAAIAPVAGEMVNSIAKNCRPDIAIPVMHIHGTRDKTVPYSGSRLTHSVDESIAYWCQLNKCKNEPDTIQIINANKKDSCFSERFNYKNEKGNIRVSLIKVNGGGHSWPGGPMNFEPTDLDIHASKLIWEFFSKYHKE